VSPSAAPSIISPALQDGIQARHACAHDLDDQTPDMRDARYGYRIARKTCAFIQSIRPSSKSTAEPERS